MASLTPFEVGAISAHVHHGYGPTQIAKVLKRADKTAINKQTIANAIAKLKENPKWRGEREPGSGSKRKTSQTEDAKIEAEVLKNRGREKVTVSSIKRKHRRLRSCSNTTVERRLHDADLAYKRRLNKSKVPEKHMPARVAYGKWVLRQRDEYLMRIMYSDGTVFYLARTQAEAEGKFQASLGSMVWRRWDGKDAMYKDCIGPSSYSKAQGVAVRVWGFLIAGKLFIDVLPEGQVLDQYYYAELIEEKLEAWMNCHDLLVQDYERALRAEESLQAFRGAGISLVEQYPSCSQDLNPVENCWNILRLRLAETQPTRIEARDSFIKRLEEAVRWMNTEKADSLKELWMDQKARARKLLAAKPPGSRIRK